MAGADSSFGTNNPFRRKSTTSSSSNTAPLPPVPSSGSAFLDGETSASLFHPDTSPVPPPLSQSPPPLSSHPTGDDFQQLLRALPKSDAPPPSTTFQKKKPVKKVRVQSPPPSSPESAHAVHAYPKYPRPPRSDDDDDESSSTTSSESLSTDRDDPFSNAPPGMADDVAGFRDGRIGQPSPSPSPPAPVAIGQAPPNPFQKTLEDMERSAKEGEQGTALTKGGMDVDAFRRLLLTGQGPVPAAALSVAAAPSHLHPTGAAGDGGSITDASSISRQSIFDSIHPPPQETPRTSHEISEPELEETRLIKPNPPASKKKQPPPPPPGSRHGKLIKIELKKDEEGRKDTGAAIGKPGSSGQASNKVSSPTERPSSSDINKPLPPAPARQSVDEDRESIFDREAAGKIPEIDIDPEVDVIPPPRPPTPPNASHSSSTPVQNPTSTLRKPAPPPPRRQTGHARTDSKPPSITGMPPPLSISPTAVHADDSEQAPERSSLDSQRSRSSSIRVNISAPAPPPPRRPHHGNRRASNSVISPTAVSFASAAAPSSTASATSPSALSDAERSPMGHAPVHGHSHLADAIRPGSDIASIPSPGGAAIPSSASALHIPHSASQPKLFPPPPPPPARNSSVRVSGGGGRPPSVSSFDATSRRVPREQREGGAASALPPPPPPRTRVRGSSKGSMDSPGGMGQRRTSVDSVRAGQDPGGDGGRPRSQTQDSAANDILADLDALQREVDAARAQFAKGG